MKALALYTATHSDWLQSIWCHILNQSELKQKPIVNCAFAFCALGSGSHVCFVIWLVHPIMCTWCDWPVVHLDFENFLAGYNREIGRLHDSVILLLLPKSFRILLSCANLGFCYSKLTGITQFKYKRKNEMNSGLSGKKTSSSKWPIDYLFICLLVLWRSVEDWVDF